LVEMSDAGVQCMQPAFTLFKVLGCRENEQESWIMQ